MVNIFKQVQMTKPKRNVFDLTHDVKMSGKFGTLYPCCVLEVVPGDTFKIGGDMLLRMAPMLAPVMHRLDATIHYFFVPNRLLWPNWENFITGQNDPDTGLPPVHPYLKLDATVTTLQYKFLDYFGIPPRPGSATSIENVSALPMSAYNLIYNEYYRDQNLVLEKDYLLNDGLNSIAPFALEQRAFEHDYFTASLPFAQKGASVDIPLGEIVLDPDWDANGANPTTMDVTMNPITGDVEVGGSGWLETGGIRTAYDPDGSLEVQATTINDLRRAFKLQEWFEKNARGGTRYTEHILSHFGVRSPDSRLQRPEYITGVKTPIVISEVLNSTGSFEFTPGEETGNPQGDMAGHGVGVANGKWGSYYAQEHGYIIGILSVLPKTAYQQGIPKHFLKNDYLDYYFPSFAHLGEQEVGNNELYAYHTQGTFGYVPRYAEYKYVPSRVAGDFRSTLNFWHLGRIFSAQPSLNQAFIECADDEFKRIFAVQNDTDYLWLHVLNKVKAIRPMPVFGTPML